jgi:hypothetical protein
MSGDPTTADQALLRRVPVIVRSWDGPNSRLGLEMDLGELPWGPFDALGKRLDLLLPTDPESLGQAGPSESQVERALRHVEHAANRCREFAQLSNGNKELWLRSQETWEWIGRYLTNLWIERDVDGVGEDAVESRPEMDTGSSHQPKSRDPEAVSDLPSLPGAAATLKIASKALRATPLGVWREMVGSLDPEAPTREEAVQTLLGVARILSTGASSEEVTPAPDPAPAPPEPEGGASPRDESDPDQVSFDFAKGYDDGYQMGRRVGLALTARNGARSKGQQPPLLGK